MENFYNYEQIINALKAEYVNARNLKKVANATKRVTKNAASFNNRKVNEKTTLENKVDSIEGVMDNTLSNARNEADQKKWTDLKTKLSELKGKLKNIENGEYLLVQSPLINPLDLDNQYEEVSTMDSNSFHMLKNLLTNAINDAENAINAAYSTDYNTLSDATIIRYEDGKLSDAQIMAKYFEKKSTLNSLFDNAEYAIYDYTNDIFNEVDQVKGHYGSCLDASRTLTYKKEQLADLLVNEGSQSDIDQKELEIESIKQNMIQYANELKLAKIRLEEKAVARFQILAEYIEDARDYANEDFYQFINVNQYFLRDTAEPNREELTDYKIHQLYSYLFIKLAQSTQIQGISESEYDQFRIEVNNARTNLLGLNNIIIRNGLREQSLADPQNLIEQDSNGKLHFKSYVTTNDILFYKDYNQILNTYTSEYIIRKADRDSKRIELRDMASGPEYSGLIQKIQNTYVNIKEAKFILRRAQKFQKWNREWYTGTQEQQNAYNNFISEHNQAFQLFISTEQSYKYNQAQYLHFNLSIFENEFNLLNTLTATKTSTEDYLSTLSENDEAYPAALISRDAAVEEYNLFLNTKFGEELFGANYYTRGQWLLDMKNNYDTSYAVYTAAEAAWNTELAEFEVLKSQMTFEEPGEYYKKEGIMRDANYISLAEDRLANLENRESGLVYHLFRIKQRVINLISEFRNESDAQFEESQLATLLLVKYFLDSENLLALNKKEIRSKEHIKSRIEREMEGMLMGKPTNPSLPSNAFMTYDLFNSLSSDPHQCRTDLMSAINSKIIKFNPESFADDIINEATNGTIWWYTQE